MEITERLIKLAMWLTASSITVIKSVGKISEFKRLKKENSDLKKENERLKGLLDEVQRR